MGVLSVLCAAPSSVTWAGESQAENIDPVQKTQEVMTDSKQRQEFLNQNKEAAKADASLRALAGNDQNTELMYQLAAEIFADMEKKSGGNPEQMMQILSEARTNPTAFMKRLSPAQLQRIKNISEKLPAAQQGAPGSMGRNPQR